MLIVCLNYSWQRFFSHSVVDSLLFAVSHFKIIVFLKERKKKRDNVRESEEEEKRRKKREREGGRDGGKKGGNVGRDSRKVPRKGEKSS